MSTHVIEWTWEEIERHKAELIGRHLRVTVMEERPAAPISTASRRPSALGKYAFVAGGSEKFAQEKRVEIGREDRPRP